jgi:hypothetical protein
MEMVLALNNLDFDFKERGKTQRSFSIEIGRE